MQLWRLLKRLCVLRQQSCVSQHDRRAAAQSRNPALSDCHLQVPVESVTGCDTAGQLRHDRQTFDERGRGCFVLAHAASFGQMDSRCCQQVVRMLQQTTLAAAGKWVSAGRQVANLDWAGKDPAKAGMHTTTLPISKCSTRKCSAAHRAL